MIRVMARDISELMAGNQWQGGEGRTNSFRQDIPIRFRIKVFSNG
jgi:hypothetical protein